MSGEFRLTGERGRPIGFGAMTIEDGVAYGEPFQNATASLRFDGTGVRLDGIEIAKGAGTHHRRRLRRLGFDLLVQRRRPADSRRRSSRSCPIRARRCPGTVELTASGSGTFDAPRNDYPVPHQRSVRRRGTVGQVTGELALRGTELSGEIDAASPRLSVTGTGRISLTPEADSELSLRFHDSSLDPYVRLFVPQPLAVHDRGRQRLDPRRRRARPTSTALPSTARSTRSTCGCSTTR